MRSPWILVTSKGFTFTVSSGYYLSQLKSKFPEFSLISTVFLKFPEFSLSGKWDTNFPGFPLFPESLGTLTVQYDDDFQNELQDMISYYNIKCCWGSDKLACRQILHLTWKQHSPSLPSGVTKHEHTFICSQTSVQYSQNLISLLITPPQQSYHGNLIIPYLAI